MTEVAENWRAINGFPNYMVSDLGRVMRIGGRVLKPGFTRGYEFVTLRRDIKSFNRRIHRLVCEAFHGPAPTPEHQVAHCDGNSRNNGANNLRWATSFENQADRIMHGTDIRGSDVHNAVLDERDIPVIKRLLRFGFPQTVVAAAYQVSPSTIHLIANDKIWRHAA